MSLRVGLIRDTRRRAGWPAVPAWRAVAVLLAGMALAPGAWCQEAEPVVESVGGANLLSGGIALEEDPSAETGPVGWRVRLQAGTLGLDGNITSVGPGTRPRILILDGRDE